MINAAVECNVQPGIGHMQAKKQHDTIEINCTNYNDQKTREAAEIGLIKRKQQRPKQIELLLNGKCPGVRDGVVHNMR